MLISKWLGDGFGEMFDCGGPAEPAFAQCAQPFTSSPCENDSRDFSLEDLFIHEEDSVRQALKKLDSAAFKTLLVVDEARRLKGTLTDGDIRRHLLEGRSLEERLGGTYNTQPTVLSEGCATLEAARNLMLERSVELLPVVADSRHVVDCITWMQVSADTRPILCGGGSLDVPVVIMAGGVGNRLDPFTKIFPKPLIPYGDKPVIQVIVDQFRECGVNCFYVTVNYKAAMVEAFFNGIQDRDYALDFVREGDFLGTAGSLRLLRGKVSGPFIVSNCDTIVKTDFADVLEHHRTQGAALTVLSAIRHYRIPYGVIRYTYGGEIRQIHEKPECTFTVNTGCYVLDPSCLDLIPEGACNMTDLAARLIERGEKVTSYPVNESDYIDLGEWGEYRRSLKHLRVD